MPAESSFTLSAKESEIIQKHEMESALGRLAPDELSAINNNEMQAAMRLSLMATKPAPPPMSNVSLTTPANETSTLEEDPTPAYVVGPRNAAELEVMGITQHDGSPRDIELNEVVQGLTKKPRDKRLDRAAKLLHERGVKTPDKVAGLVNVVRNREGKGKGKSSK